MYMWVTVVHVKTQLQNCYIDVYVGYCGPC